MLTFSKPKVKQDAANSLKFERKCIAAEFASIERLPDTYQGLIQTRIRLRKWNYIHHKNQGYSVKKPDFRVNWLTLPDSGMLLVYAQVRDCPRRQPN